MRDGERRSLSGLVDQLWPTFEFYGPRPDPTPSEGPDPYGNQDPEWLTIDWRDHLKVIHVPPASSASPPGAGGPADSTTAVNYVELGPPEPEQAPRAIVFVHGLSGCWQNWLESLPRFASSHRVIALDLPGFGASPAPAGRFQSRLTGACCGSFATPSRSATASWSATRWADSSPRRR